MATNRRVATTGPEDPRNVAKTRHNNLTLSSHTSSISWPDHRPAGQTKFGPVQPDAFELRYAGPNLYSPISEL